MCYAMINGDFSPQFRAIQIAGTRTIAIMKKISLMVCSLVFFCQLGNAATQQDHAALSAVVSNFVRQQTTALPGKVAFNVDEIDSRINLPSCNDIEAFLPGGSKLLGRVSIGVRCNEINGWRIFVPVQIKVSMALLSSARPLVLGQVIHAEDLARQTVETSQSGGLSDASRVIGQVMRYSVSAGIILQETMLRAPYSVKQGQPVQLLTQGSGFSISGSGVALNNAAQGESVPIRTASGRVISGIAGENGVVNLMP